MIEDAKKDTANIHAAINLNLEGVLQLDTLAGFKNIQLQKLLGNLSVSISNIRNRNEQEYKFFANPIKPFLLAHFDWNWYNNLRKKDADTSALNVINRYAKQQFV